MALEIKHAFSCLIPDDPASAAAGEVVPSNWNASHSLTGRADATQLMQGSALSVLGVAGNAVADQASIVAATDKQVMRRSGTSIGFGAIDLASSDAVTGTLAVANGGTGAGSFTAGRLLIGNGTGAVTEDADLAWDGANKMLTANTLRLLVRSDNIFLGKASGNTTQTGINNVCLGINSLDNLTTGADNVVMGYNAGAALTSGVGNMFIGTSAGLNAGDAHDNVGIGKNALQALTTGIRNMGIGFGALTNLNTGQSNIAIGRNSGVGINTGSNCVCIGTNASVNLGGAFNRVVIGGAHGTDTIGDTNNQVFLGNSLVTAWVPGATGVASLGRSDRAFQQIFLDYTNTATVGNVTINKASGTVNLAALGTTLTLTNSLIATTSRIMLTLASDPGSAIGSLYAVPAAGSCTINVTTAVTNQTKISFEVIN